MKRTLFSTLLVLTIGASAQNAITRPRITGIDHLAFYTTSPEKNRELYATVLGLSMSPAVEPGETQRFNLGNQWIGYSPAPDANATDRMDHVAYGTDDAASLRLYLAEQNVKVPQTIRRLPDGSKSFLVQDPEGHSVEFVERPRPDLKASFPTGAPVSRRLIHAGFIVSNRSVEDRFYKGILGFHIYWHGGMKPEDTDWVAMQVPDGTDWLEYMLNIDPHPDLQTMGEMNHVSLGVVDMKLAEAKMESNGWKPKAGEGKEIGRDGKWQLDVYDPDSSRVELMEFKPTQKPCCSDFQGPHPREQ